MFLTFKRSESKLILNQKFATLLNEDVNLFEKVTRRFLSKEEKRSGCVYGKNEERLLAVKLNLNANSLIMITK